MSFFSNVLPIWNKALSTSSSGDVDQTSTNQKVPEPSSRRKSGDNKNTKAEVKLPSIPIDFSDHPERGRTTPGTRPRPRSRCLVPVGVVDTFKCMFCGNQNCLAYSKDMEHCANNRPQAVGVGRQKQSRRQKKTRQEIMDNSKVRSEVILSSPRSPKLDSNLVRLECSSPREFPLKSEGSGASWEPFSSLCRYCGLKFGRHSIAIHERRCNRQRQHKNNPQNPQTSSKENTQSGNGGLQKIATIVTMGLGVGMEKTTVYANLPPRPHTRTIKHSSLHASGYGLPLAGESAVNGGSSTILCEQCEQVVAADRISVHRRLCKPKLPLVSAGNVTFPSACDLLCTKDKKDEIVRRSCRKPPTKVCYICGREFGSRSIDIHEPQCMKKWQAENRKLPISERKPTPKKPESKSTIARTLSTTDASRPIKSLPANVYKDHDISDIEDSVQKYFLKCYSEFERDLVPCKKCGRTFAPERHRQHEQSCNAKPVIGKKINTQTT